MRITTLEPVEETSKSCLPLCVQKLMLHKALQIGSTIMLCYVLHRSDSLVIHRRCFIGLRQPVRAASLKSVVMLK